MQGQADINTDKIKYTFALHTGFTSTLLYEQYISFVCLSFITKRRVLVFSDSNDISSVYVFIEHL